MSQAKIIHQRSSTTRGSHKDFQMAKPNINKYAIQSQEVTTPLLPLILPLKMLVYTFYRIVMPLRTLQQIEIALPNVQPTIILVSIYLNPRSSSDFCIYRPPRDDAKLNLDHIFAAIGSAPSVLCGEFNAHHTLWNDPHSNSSQHLTNSITQPIYVLDLAFLSTNLLPLS